MSSPSDRLDTRVCVVGLGYVGSCIAASLWLAGAEVVGVDTDPGLIRDFNDGHCRIREPGLPELMAKGIASGRLTVTTGYDAVGSAGTVIVTVGTPIDETGAFAETQLRAACEELGRRVRPGQLLVFKSTVPPGTTRDLVIPLLEQGGLVCGEDVAVAFCPERLSEGSALAELQTLPVVVGGLGPADAAAAERFWRGSLGVEVIRCSSLEAAETVKLADNWWLDHNIALANELARYCATIDVDVLEVIAAANSIPKGSGNVNILLPSVGVGGSCLTKDPWMIARAARANGVELRTVPTAREVNDAMPAYTAGLILDELARRSPGRDRFKVAVLGVAFKNNTGDLRATPVLPVVRALRAAGAEVTLFDPLADDGEVAAVFGTPPAPSLDDAIGDADCLALLAWHDEFSAIDLGLLRERVARSCLIVDGRAYLPRSTITRLQELGFLYRGIGR
ncbi:nucleotide sugar dehydrogenase [Nonomuraea sp. CA-218870]|uniref:nucleotide sugar dehydrogenase n=1 Tax=Nonomuraea sp. CA-218870 TaxID=3239998 RepID=UPI003D8D814D